MWSRLLFVASLVIAIERRGNHGGGRLWTGRTCSRPFLAINTEEGEEAGRALVFGWRGFSIGSGAATGQEPAAA